MPRGKRTGTMTDAETLDRHEAGESMRELAALEGVSSNAIRARIAHERKRRSADMLQDAGTATLKITTSSPIQKPVRRAPVPAEVEGVYAGIFDGLNAAVAKLEKVLAR